MTSTIGLMLSVGLLPSSLKVRYYRWRGAKIGKGVHLGLFSLIQAHNIEIGDYSRIGMMVRIKAKVLKIGAYSQIRQSTSIIAPRVSIGNETIIMNDVVVGGMESWDSQFRIGDRCTIFPKCFINPTCDVIIGDDVGIGGANYIFTHGSWSNALEGFPIDFGPITIEDRVWLPWRVFVLPNVTIGHDSVIGAGSVVSRSVPPLSLAAGSPARVIRTGVEFVSAPSKEEKLNKLKEWLKEFPKFLRIEHMFLTDSTSSDSQDSLILHSVVTDGNKKNLGTIILNDSITVEDLQDLRGHIYVVSLEQISESIKNHVERSNGAWFDLSKYQWNGDRNPVSIEIRAFFARYGIRFESLDLL